MKLLLDTHIVIWAIMDDPRLTRTAKALMTENAGECFFSAASIWPSRTPCPDDSSEYRQKTWRPKPNAPAFETWMSLPNMRR